MEMSTRGQVWHSPEEDPPEGSEATDCNSWPGLAGSSFGPFEEKAHG